MEKKPQTPQTARLAAKIRRIRERQMGGKQTLWRTVCLTCNILTEKGEPDTGLAYKIAYDEYEPGHAVRLRLGMSDICTECHRPKRKPSVRAKTKHVQPWQRWWWKLTPMQRDEKIRKEFEENNDDYQAR